MQEVSSLREIDSNEIDQVSGGLSFSYTCVPGMFEWVDVGAFGYHAGFTSAPGFGRTWYFEKK